MKTTCAPDFLVTLSTCGLTYQDWRVVRHVHAQVSRGRRPKRPHRLRQFVRKVQQAHTGRGAWIGGQYVRRERRGQGMVE